jgi:cation diffusion facilitator CzcD-associated flavoprotein CzcO
MWCSTARTGRGGEGLSGTGPGGDLLVETGHGTWAVRAVINATGTWSAPNLPWYPGIDTFTGRQLHSGSLPPNRDITGGRALLAVR